MFKFINPIYLILKLGRMLKEFNNALFYYKKVKEIERRGMMTLVGMRVDKVRRVYAAVNLPPELRLYSDNVKLDKREKELVGVEITKMMRVFDDNGLFDLYRMKHVRVCNDTEYGYKIVFSFRFREISVWWVLWYPIFILLVAKLVMWFDLQATIDWFKEAFTFNEIMK